MSIAARTLLGCAALAWALPLLAQPPTVVGVANSLLTSPVLTPGSVGYVLGAGFGTVANTTVQVGGLNARALAVSKNRIRVLIPADLPSGSAMLTVAVDGKASEPVRIIVTPATLVREIGRDSVSPGPGSPPAADTQAPETQAPDMQTTAASPGGGIVYTCDGTVTAASSTACNTLNTTIAALYKSAFGNVNASIYVQLGATALGSSNWSFNRFNYSDYRSALAGAQSDADDATALADSLPASNPFGIKQVGLTDPLQRALGFSAASCLPANSCYDGTITVSNSQPLYFRNGTISGNQFDFFSVVEHETDEILGTASCAAGCSGFVFPSDFFRYHSNGSRSFAAGSNNSCSSSDATNACFSLDSAQMLQQYNNMSGGDFGDWVTNCANPLVQDAAICAGKAGVDISSAAEIRVLDVVGYTLGSGPGPGAVTNVSSSTANGTYGPGATISIQIAFNETVTVAGVPQLTLNSGGTASYSSGSGTATLTFLYPVAAGQSSAHLDYTSVAALTLSGGTIHGPGGASVSLTLPSPGAAGSLGANSSIVIGAVTTHITIQTNPPGLFFTVDSGTAQTAPQTLSLTQGSHTIAVNTTQGGGTGTRYVFTNWSDSGAASHSIVVGSSPASYTATFKTQYQLTTQASPANGGTVTPVSGGFSDSGTAVPIVATPNNAFSFAGWSGSVANPSAASTTVTLNGPATVIANFSAASGITIQTNPPGLLFIVDNGSPQIAPQSLNLSPGSHTIAVNAVQAAGVGSQYAFTGWSDGGAASHSISVGASAATFTASFKIQYQLSTAASPPGEGTVTPPGGAFYDAGATVPVTATASTGFFFTNWSGGVALPNSASTTVTMGGPESVIANFAAASGVTIQTSPPGLQFTLDNGLAQVAPQSFNLAPGLHNIAVVPLQASIAGTQYVFLGWSDGGAAQHPILVGSSAATYTATFTGIGGIVGGGLSIPAVTAISANGYFTVFGDNFAAAPRLLAPSDLLGDGSLPTNLGNTCVNVGSARAFPTYISPTQINAIAPSLALSASTAISVVVNCGTSNEVVSPVVAAPLAAASPEFLYWVQNLNGQDPIIAVDAIHGDFIGTPGLIPGLTFRRARSGDILTLYGIGFGRTAAGPVPGTLPAVADFATPGYSVTVGSTPASTFYVGVTPGSAGLYQVNVAIPEGLSPGNYSLVLNVNGASSPSGAFLAIGP